jgi:hypothetical protein
MVALPFLIILASKRPAGLRVSAERLSGGWGLRYNIAQRGGRTALIVIFFAAFHQGAPEPRPAAFAGTLSEAGA